MIALPTFQDDPASTYSVALDGTPYLVTLRWNARGTFWTLDIATADGVELATGVQIILNQSLLFGRTDLRLPTGELGAFDPTGTLARIGRYDWAPVGSAVLLYVPADEIEEAA